MKPLCIYHGNCADGFGAAWAVRKFFGDGNVDFHAGVYQDAPPDVTGRDVYLVDFSYKRPVLETMAASASKVTVLDHHKTAEADLTPFPDGVMGEFDMDRSGAMIAWDWFHPGQEPPQLLRHIQDRDLWRFNLEGTREIQAALFSYPYDFTVWDELMQWDVATLHAEGVAIERKHFKDIDELLDVTMRHMEIGGHRVPVANLPYTLTSDAGHKMAEGNAFAACYWDTPDGRVFSLRSTNGGLDVSEIARQYGGGGHAAASGFRVPFDHELGRA